MTIATPAVVTRNLHGSASGQPVKFATTGALPTGVVAGTIYYVIAAGLTTNAFQCSATVGGAAVNTSGAQSGTHTVEKTGALPTGVTAGTVYYARNVTTDTFEFATAPGGASIATSGTQSGTFNVATGNDSNSGLTLAQALLTTQAAWDKASNLDGGTHDIFIQLADSVYTSVTYLNFGPVAGNQKYIQGNTTFPSNVLVSTTGTPCFAGGGRVSVTFRGMEVRTFTSGSCFYAANFAYFTIGSGMRFGACAEAHLRADTLGFILAQNFGYTVSGAAGYHAFCNGGSMTFSGVAMTVYGNPAWAAAFAQVSGPCLLVGYLWTIAAGSATGTRTVINGNGVMNLFGAAQSTLPGSANGTPTTGGQII
ncbi:MAG: hypothetical protein Q7V17_15035 [Afipia sp.]|nr:hypothetical protein [Afipia sp.]